MSKGPKWDRKGQFNSAMIGLILPQKAKVLYDDVTVDQVKENDLTFGEFNYGDPPHMVAHRGKNSITSAWPKDYASVLLYRCTYSSRKDGKKERRQERRREQRKKARKKE